MSFDMPRRLCEQDPQLTMPNWIAGIELAASLEDMRDHYIEFFKIVEVNARPPELCLQWHLQIVCTSTGIPHRRNARLSSPIYESCSCSREQIRKLGNIFRRSCYGFVLKVESSAVG